ncbi:MAG TPA: c-type cytochrome [Steroidobacter sp.]|nr:c-type cytochrome [Steroidobacteraceae bacterium]HLS81279.1 c-type cytochrome [Steroidobacter sp.]
MKFQPMILVSAACVLFAHAGAAAEGSAAAGQSKTATCVACHGAGGNSANPEWPSLAGQHDKYVVQQLEAFKSGARQDPLMSAMAVPLSAQDMADLAAYYSEQTLTTNLEADPAKLSLGQRLYRGGDATTGVTACAACHGPRGEGNPSAAYPRIGGQHAAYIAKQLRAYRAGTRQTDANQMMRNVAHTMSDEQIDAVASYVQGLR